MTCPAEAPFNDEIVYCRLLDGHLTRWHEGWGTIRCGNCGRRDAHTESCPNPHEVTDRSEVLRWEGPAAPMPELDHWDRIVADRWHQLIHEGQDLGGGRVRVDKASMIATEMIFGRPDRFDDFLEAAEEWGRDLTRELDIERRREVRT